MGKRIVSWSPTARNDIRAIDRQTALGILHAVDVFLTSGGGGDVIKPHTACEGRGIRRY